MKAKILSVVLAFSLVPIAHALLVVGDTGEDSIYTDGAGAGAGWNYVGHLIGSAPSSVSYVANGWFVTAQHVWDNEVVGSGMETLNLGGTIYNINTDTHTSITNASGGAADLCMFRVANQSGLPGGMAVSESTPIWTDSLRLIGNGFDNASQTGMTWGNAIPYAIYILIDFPVVTLTAGTTESFLAVYDSGVEGRAYAQTFDSGGGVFVDGQLAGIMFSAGTYGGQTVTYVADFGTYGEQINETSAIPEPATAVLVLGCAGVLGLVRRIVYLCR